MKRKGIVLAGGSGKRLAPLTRAVVKQLLPIYDKPMIYYPISVLMLAGIRDILVICNPLDLPLFENLLGDGSQLGVNFQYAAQPSPDGLAQAFIIGRDFIGDDPAALILGDNMFFGSGLEAMVSRAAASQEGAIVFAYRVKDPERYGVIEFDEAGQPIGIVEKPTVPRSNFAITGLYFYDNEVIDIATRIKPSARGELEISDVNRVYLERGRLSCERMGRGYAWMDAGTPDSLLEASQYVHAIQSRQGISIACLEEVALRKGNITQPQFMALAANGQESAYGKYLSQIGESDLILD